MESFINDFDVNPKLIRPFWGAVEYIKGKTRFCLWIDKNNMNIALSNKKVKKEFPKSNCIGKIAIDLKQKNLLQLRTNLVGLAILERTE